MSLLSTNFRAAIVCMAIGFLLGLSQAKGQEAKFFKSQAFQSADYIFECSVLDVKPFKDSTKALNILKIHKVFKGNLQKGTIGVISDYADSAELFTLGTCDDCRMPNNNDNFNVYPSSADPIKGLFLGKKASLDIKPASAQKLSNKVLLELKAKTQNFMYYNTRYFYNDPEPPIVNHSFNYFLDEKIREYPNEVGTDTLTFETLNRFYTSLENETGKFVDLTGRKFVQERMAPKIDTAPAGTTEPIPDTMGEYYQKQYEKINPRIQKLFDTVKQNN
jgi:hypothetical protein